MKHREPKGHWARYALYVYLFVMGGWLIYLAVTSTHGQRGKDERWMYFVIAATPFWCAALVRAFLSSEIAMRGGAARRDESPVIFWLAWLLLVVVQLAVIVWIIYWLLFGSPTYEPLDWPF